MRLRVLRQITIHACWHTRARGRSSKLFRNPQRQREPTTVTILGETTTAERIAKIQAKCVLYCAVVRQLTSASHSGHGQDRD
jgi:hypothetical protein